jgi:transcriptional antiterminator NusG
VIEDPQNTSQQLPGEASLPLHSQIATSSEPIGGDASARKEPQHEAVSGATGPAESSAAEEHDEAVSTAGEGAAIENATAESDSAQAGEHELLDEEAEEPERGPIEETPVVDEPPKMDWYILKVQSNREDSIRESLKRRVAVAGLERFFGEIIVPTETVSEFKGGKKRVVKRKLYPGYLVVNMEINEETWFLVRETPGIGDFTGSAGKPTPMLAHEVSKIVSKQEEKTDEAPKLKINFNVGDRVKINEGTFDNFEGEVDAIDEASGRVTVMINIFGRSTPVELEYWQIESI